MATLVFDIETVGEQWEDFDVVTQDSLTRWIDKTARSESEHVALLDDLQSGLGFSPLTGKVVAIGLYDLERKQGAVYYTGAGDEPDVREGEYVLKQRSEQEMLAEFWEGAKNYDTFVTFNGRSFDAPFLIHRSVIHGICPTKDLMQGRYRSQQKNTRHIDLQDEMTFYGAVQRRGNLHLFCRAYGIESPKQGGVTGDAVSNLFAAGRYADIARYNVSDVVATTLLYKKWSLVYAKNST